MSNAGSDYNLSAQLCRPNTIDVSLYGEPTKAMSIEGVIKAVANKSYGGHRWFETKRPPLDSIGDIPC